MLEQLREFTSKWYGEVIPNKTDLCSFSLKTLYAVIKFGGLVALVLQPVAFGPLALLAPEVTMYGDNDLLSFYYYACVILMILYGAAAITVAVTFLCCSVLPLISYLRNTIEKVRCSKTIKFTDEDD